MTSAATCCFDRPSMRGGQLAEHLGLGLAGLALLQRLADAHDRRHPVALDRRGLVGHHAIGLAEQLAPLAVPADHVAHLQLGQERRRDLAGEGALVLPVAVLGAEGERQVVGGDQRLDAADVGERRMDADVDVLGRLLGHEVASFCTVWMASKWLRCIFQLPLMSGRRASATCGCFAQRLQARAGRRARAARAMRHHRSTRGRRRRRGRTRRAPPPSRRRRRR